MYVEEEEQAPGPDIVSRYEMIRDYSRTMRHYAKAGDWDRLVALQTTYVGAMEALADAEVDSDLSELDAGRKYALVLEIQAAEADIRACLDRRLGELSESMSNSQRRQDVAQAYERQGRS